jgi:hypothetical protein
VRNGSVVLKFVPSDHELRLCISCQHDERDRVFSRSTLLSTSLCVLQSCDEAAQSALPPKSTKKPYITWELVRLTNCNRQHFDGMHATVQLAITGIQY